jgi:sugar lactone lactonase YvrE
MSTGRSLIGLQGRRRLLAGAAGLACLAAFGNVTEAASSLTRQPDDPRAVTVKAVGDGRVDDTAAIQAALDQGRGSGEGGVVFLPSGRYRITRTLFLWPGVRLFGVGATRPVLVLKDQTPGFEHGVAAMVVFAGAGPDAKRQPPFPVPNSVPPNDKIYDANSGTFYSALSNIDFAIGEGDAGAVAVRFHAAQHAFLSHIDFHIGSGLAGVYQVGNEAEDLHFYGGRYGILTEKTSPAWQFTLLDSSFERQGEAAIREHEAGLTLVHDSFRNTPVAVEIDKGYGDWLWGEHLRFDNISQAGVVISNEDNAYTQVGFEDVDASRTPVFARFRDSGKTAPGPAPTYRVKSFSYGLTLPGLGQMGRYETRLDAAAIVSSPPQTAPAIRPLPPVVDWVDVRTLGAKGDNAADDTAALQGAIDTHRVLYFPIGRYKVSDTLRLRPDTVLIGLHPSLTQIVLADDTPGYGGVGAPKPMIEAAKGGRNIVSGIGLFTGGVNPRAMALLWTAGAESLVDDVKLQGGHGTLLADGKRAEPYNANHSADPDPRKRWDGQYPSLWVTNGGGGTFADIWSPDTYAQAGFYVSNTSTPGHVYELSNEHHVRNEIVLDGVANWELIASQTEEEAGESADAVSLEIRNSHDILVANYHAYRVTRNVKPAVAAVKIYNSADIRFRNVHVNAESGFSTCDALGCATYLRASHFPYENALVDVTHGLQVREREFAVLDIPAEPAPVAPSTFEGGHVETLQDGFYGLSGAAVDGQGRLYFADRHDERIYRWTPEHKLEVVRDNALDPVQLAFDRTGDLMVLSWYGAQGTVYSLRPDAPETELNVIAPTPVATHARALTALPSNWWVNGEFKDQLDPKTLRFTTLGEMFTAKAGEPNAAEYVSPDGSLVLPAFRVFQQGPPDQLGWRFSPTLDASGLVMSPMGGRVYVANESRDITYAARVAAGGALVDLKPFANRGGEAVAVDPEGLVYVANGQVFVYAPDGREIGRIDTPERPIGLAFGGPDRRTLYILSQHGLFGVTK